MITVKFDHSVKYNGIRYAAHEVFKAEDKDMEALKNSGAIIVSTEENAPLSSGEENTSPSSNGEEGVNANTEGEGEENGGEDVEALKEGLLSYTAPQLTAFAKERGIDLQGKTRKADIYNIIVATLN